MCVGPTLSAVSRIVLVPVCAVSAFSFIHKKAEDLQPWRFQLVQIPDLIYVIQKVHIPPKLQTSNQVQSCVILGVACLIRSQLLLVGDVIISWWPCPVEETTLPHD